MLHNQPKNQVFVPVSQIHTDVSQMGYSSPSRYQNPRQEIQSCVHVYYPTSTFEGLSLVPNINKRASFIRTQRQHTTLIFSTQHQDKSAFVSPMRESHMSVFVQARAIKLCAPTPTPTSAVLLYVSCIHVSCLKMICFNEKY